MRALILSLVCVFLFGYLFSQTKTLELNPAAGDEFTAGDITLSWTIGEGIIETFSNNEMVLTQGFQQPTLNVTLIDETEEFDFQFNVYPNPTTDFIIIDVLSENEMACTAELFDMSGKLLFRKSIKGKELRENIDLSNYSSNLYILRILDNGGEFLKTYKIRKIK